jgi:hypothetical protein
MVAQFGHREVPEMPINTHTLKLHSFIATLAGAALIACAAPALASASCPSSPSSAMLEEYGDQAHYSLLAGSTFEGEAPGWTLNKADVITTQGVHGATHALAIQPGGTAVSPSFCVSSEYPSFRFFARQLSGGGFGAGMSVSLRYVDSFGWTHQTGPATITPASSWTLSPVLGLASALPLWMPGATLRVQLVFQPSWAASYAMANIYIDPYSRR